MKYSARLIIDSSGRSIRVSNGFGGTMEFNPETLEPYGPGVAVGSEWEARQFQKAARAFKAKMEAQEGER